jgi:glycyl-tRNA synthetase beta chain
MIELVFEIGCEDLPARFVDPALDQLEEGFGELCEDRRVEVDGIRSVGTPRRLTLLVESLAETQEDLSERQLGPPAQVAFDDGEPTGAARGFASSKGVDVDELMIVEEDGEERVAADVYREGESIHALLPEMLDALIADLQFPKSMRWGHRDERFGRAVRWITAVADGQVVPVSFAGVESTGETRGHRFTAPETFSVETIEDYEEGLREADVVVDPAERRDEIEASLEALAAEVDGRVVEDPDLVDEVVHLVENPHATRLDFDDSYLELPDEVLVTSMRSHQRYFAIEDADQPPEAASLIAHCGVIYNTPVRDPEVVNEGNLRVLRARLDDARFFWENDRETALEDRLERLDDVVWLEQIGSMADRARRMSTTAGDLARVFEMGDAAEKHARRAGRLAKADLVTQMVDEFPDLQGVMGREYALDDGEPETVARAIEEQYLPEGSDDALPASPEGQCVALAEKLDALVGCFGVGLEPSSSSDPYGLRRAALGVIRIVDDLDWTGSVRELLELTHDAYIDVQGNEGADHTGDPEVFDVSRSELIDRLTDFIARRLRYLLIEDYPTDVVDAVLAADDEHLADVFMRVEALASLKDEPDFEPLALGFKRVVNILEKEDVEAGGRADSVDPAEFEAPEEEALWNAYNSIENDVDAAVEARNWEAACQALIRLKSPVDAFFDTVMVMADDPALRRNRVAMLDALRELFWRVADISKIG